MAACCLPLIKWVAYFLKGRFKFNNLRGLQNRTMNPRSMLPAVAKTFFLTLAITLLHTGAGAQAKTDISSFQLPNGFTVWVARDTSFNEVALYLFADAGFRKEAPGQHGMAHLFEHVMLPSRYYRNEELSKQASLHSINSNAQVFNDYVRYYVHYDKNGLDYGLIALADRLDYQVDSLTDESLQRHINNVRSEIARSESFGSFRWRPLFREAQARGLFGAAHPYGHEQSLSDVSRATRRDVQTWYQRWYGASNASLLVLGNVDTAALREKVTTYFSGVQPGRAALRPVVPLPQFETVRSDELTFSTDKHVAYFAWTLPGYGTREDDYFRLLSSILAHPTNGLLVKALDAAGIKGAKPFSQTESHQYASVFDAGVEFTDWRDKEKIEAILQEAVRGLTRTPLPSVALQQAAALYQLQTLKSLEGIGMYDERVAEMGRGALYLGNPLYYEKRLSRLSELTPAAFQQVLAVWLVRPPYNASIRGQKLSATAQAYDYKKSVPFVAPSAPVALPIHTQKLGPHLSFHSVRQSRLPVVDFLIAFENAARLPATALAAFQESVRKHFEKDVHYAALRPKGLETAVHTTDKTIVYKVSTGTENAPQVYQWLAGRLAQLESITENGKEGDIASQLNATLEELKFAGLPPAPRLSRYPLSAVHFIVVGDADAQAFPVNALSVHKTHFIDVAPPAPVPDSGTLVVKNIGESPTSFLTLGHRIKPASLEEEVYQSVLLYLLRARLMNNLREKNGLVYEIYPYATAPVVDGVLAFWQTQAAVEKTQPAVQQLAAELKAIGEGLDKRLPTARAQVLASLKGKFNSLTAIEQTVLETIEYRRQPDYFARAVDILNKMTLSDFEAFLVAKARPEHFRLVVFTTPKLAPTLSW